MKRGIGSQDSVLDNNITRLDQQTINRKKLKNQFTTNNIINLILTVFSLSVVGAFNIGTAFLFKSLSDVAISGTIKQLINLIIIAILFIIGYIFFYLLQRSFICKFIYKAMKQFKNYIFEKILYKKINAFNKERSSEYVSALTNDMSTIESNYLLGGLNMILQCVLFIAGLSTMIYLSWFLTLCTIVACIIPLIATSISGNRLEKYETLTSKLNGSFVALIEDLLSGFPVIKSFQAEKETLEAFKQRNIQLEVAKRNRRGVSQIINLVSFSSTFLVTVVISGVGAYLSIKGIVTLGTVIAFIQLLDYVVNPIGQIGNLYSNRRAAKALIDRMSDLCLTEEEQEGIQIDEFKRSIVFNNVSFTYEVNNKTLSNINIEFELGKSYVIVGTSGCGKSTLLHLLLGYFNNYEGNILIDSKEIKDIKAANLYNIISIIQQNVIIFDESIKTNITMFKNFKDEEVQNAINISGLANVIEQKGLDYPCGVNGCNLSGGEKQRIAIARCLLKKTPILLMDEATSALDNETESKIYDEIVNIKGITRIVITHKLQEQNLNQYDQIIVMNNGKIEEKGKFNELIDLKGYFYSLHNIHQKP